MSASLFRTTVILNELHILGGNGIHGTPSAPGKAYISGVSPEMLPVQRMISEIAATDIPVLLLGESGTGKEIAAMQIHSLSQYRDLRFVKLACSTVTAEFFESRFSPPINGNGNKSENRTGTLFLDEIGELDQDCQRRLLHSVPDGSSVPAGQPGGGRIVSCSTRDLEADVHHGKFRSELFYRLSGVCVQLPPLRRRRDDIPLLVRHFLNKYAGVFHRTEMTLSDRVMQLLIEYPWPGNIRQLENVVKRIVALANEELGIVDLKVSPMLSSLPHAAIAPSRSLKAASRAASRQAERELILQTLERTHWNRKRAAEALQISYKSLLFKLKQIQVPESEEV
jgi:two-component system, NtrC family, response regulator AtoC